MIDMNLALAGTHAVKVPKLSEKYFPLSSALRGKSTENYFHSRRVAGLSNRLGQMIGLSLVEIHFLTVGAELHDAGKVKVPIEILHSEAALTNKEWTVMRTHTTSGASLAAERKLDSRVVDAMLFHHERWDGHGYPTGRMKEEIPLNARIVTLVDAYDTMIFQRVYQAKPRRIVDAVSEIERCAGTQFDPDLALIFLRYLRERYAIGN